MQRTILALILSTALVGIGFLVGRTPAATDDIDNVVAAEAPTTSTTDNPTTVRTRPSSTANSGSASFQVEASPTTEPTTTTVAATATTAAPATTTTKPPPPPKPPIIASSLAIPATVTYPGGLKAGGGYDITASNAETGVLWWTAPYLGTNLPYTAGAQWVAGDREGYRCGYGFILDSNGEIDGRFAFVRPPDQTYAKVSDTYMEEGVRYLDGSLYTGGGNEVTEEDCTNVMSPIDYEGACRPVDERPRVGYFDEKGNILDIRDYSNTAATNVNFNLHSFNGSRATVIACEDGLVGMIVYYDSMGNGQLAVDFKGTGPYK
jgi:hypothetical protein